MCVDGDLWTAKWWTQGDTPGGAGTLAPPLNFLQHGFSYTSLYSGRVGRLWRVLRYSKLFRFFPGSPGYTILCIVREGYTLVLAQCIATSRKHIPFHSQS